MANCPSALPTAITRVEDVPGGVALLITSPEPETQQVLRLLADRHERAGKPQGPSSTHTGMHGGPGTIGHCPIVHIGTHVSYVGIADGVRVEVRILPGHDVDALRREIYARVVHLPEWVAKK